jgi:hypothetical protein
MALDTATVSSWIGSRLLAATAILGSAVAGAAADYKTGTCQTPTIDTPPSATSPASPHDPYTPALGWQTRQPSLICESYFRVQDGEKAALSGDRKWLAETGCIIVQGGLRLVLLDTPDYRFSGAWRARLYDLSGDSRDVYLRSVDAVGFASAGTYKSEKEAQIAVLEMKRRYKRHHERDSDLPHRIMPFGPERVKLWIGPGVRWELYNFCDDVQEDKETVTEMTARNKREQEARSLRLFEAIRKGEPLPKPESLPKSEWLPKARGRHLNCEMPSKQ